MDPKIPQLDRVLETALYVEDLDRAESFYRDLFAFDRLAGDERMRALDVAGRQVLLLFREGGSTRDHETSGGTIPAHDARGQIHLAFAVPAEALEAWRERLDHLEIPLESEVGWERGGRSLYFRDPDGHLVELVTPGLWTTY